MRGWHRDGWRHSLAAKGVSTVKTKRSFMAQVYLQNVGVPEEIKSLSELFRSEGAKGVFLVGGYVRDSLLGRPPKDIDLEIHGMTPDEIQRVLQANGYEVVEVGKSFGVLKVKVGGEVIDVSVPRTDASGRKPDVTLLEDATPEEAAKRRDLTINAIMYDVLNGAIVDPYGGIEDLQSDTIRATTEQSFPEDPLRVLRAAQFSSRFGFNIEPKTVEMAKGVDVASMSGERIKDELEKALLKSERPSLFFQRLDEMGQLDKVFPEVARLKGIQQSSIHHPEGDAYVHTMEVLDRVRANSDDRELLLSALLHDTGKFTKTVVDEEGKIRAIGHEEDSAMFAKDLLNRLKYDKKTLGNVTTIAKWHMRPKDAARSERKDLKTVNRILVDIAGGVPSLMADPEKHLTRYKKIMELEKADSPKQARQFEELKQALPPLEHYKQKIDTQALKAQGLQEGPEFGKRVAELYRQKISVRKIDGGM